MITLTKEWLLKTIAELEEERDATPGAVNEDAEMALAAMKLALASLEAEKERKHHSVIAEQLAHVLSGLDATDHQRAVISCAIDRLNNVAEILQRSPSALPAPPAPVSVPDEWTIADAVRFCKETGRQDAGAAMDAWNACRAAMLQDAEPVSQTYELPELIEGMEVSIDVSTCDADAGNRYFGTVTEVSELDTAKNGYILLVQDAEPNFKTAGNSPVIPDGWVPCSERMPEDEQEVLTRNRMGHCFVSFFDEHSGLFFDRVDVTAACCIEHILVTHWMPLPAAPQEVK
ncbi:DUF551 domain-containing protein [Citrobacter sedlakii]